MTIQQMLCHRVLFVLGNIIRSGRVATYVGKKVLELVSRIEKGGKALCGVIQGNNGLRRVMDSFQEQL